MFHGDHNSYSVDYPPMESGVGKAAYLRTVNLLNVVIYYRTHVCLFNTTPHSLHRLALTTKRKLFYVSHYCKIYKQGEPYIVQLMWPVWIGYAPHGLLHQNMPGWFNPYKKNKWQTFHVGEFAYVNLLHLPPYEQNFQPLDFTRSPLDRHEIEEWWTKVFLPKRKVDPKSCFGYAIYQFTEVNRVASPAYVPAMAPAHEELWKEQLDHYKAAMSAATARPEEIPGEALCPTMEIAKRERARDEFNEKWAMLGFEIPEKLEINPVTHLPDGKKLDPMDTHLENIMDFFDKYADPETYFLRKEIPPGEGNTLQDHVARYDCEQDSVVPLRCWRTIRPRPDRARRLTDEEALAFGLHADPEDLKTSKYWDNNCFNAGIPKSWLGRVFKQAAEDECFEETARFMWNRFQYTPYRNDEELRADFHYWYNVHRRKWHLAENDLPRTPYDEFPEPEAEWSSDEEGNYSASWMEWGDARAYREFGGPEDDMADDLLEDWAWELREERGDATESMDWSWASEPLVKQPPARHDPESNPYVSSFKKMFSFWEDPRHEE